jgi:hypothetical protein
MSNTTWIGLFVVAVVVFYLNSRKKKRGTPPAAQREPVSVTPSSDVPDGQYLAKYLGEQADGLERIILSLEITEGELKGTTVPMVFENAAAKQALKDMPDSHLRAQLANEDVSLAQKLENNILGHDDRSFLIRTKEGKAVSVYTYDDAKIKTFMNKLAKDPSFRG